MCVSTLEVKERVKKWALQVIDYCHDVVVLLNVVVITIWKFDPPYFHCNKHQVKSSYHYMHFLFSVPSGLVERLALIALAVAANGKTVGRQLPGSSQKYSQMYIPFVDCTGVKKQINKKSNFIIIFILVTRWTKAAFEVLYTYNNITFVVVPPFSPFDY